MCEALQSDMEQVAANAERSSYQVQAGGIYGG